MGGLQPGGDPATASPQATGHSRADPGVRQHHSTTALPVVRSKMDEALAKEDSKLELEGEAITIHDAE